jgi:two-component sensor histidine kinase|tara:strand:- start:477 stop:1988 length:1512 start_codon:yes stop_codon:yes gene_type:complete
MFLILTLALLPLGLVALFASLQAIRTADMERVSLLKISVVQSARTLSSETSLDRTALRIGISGSTRGRVDPQQCERISMFIRSRTSSDTIFAIYNTAGRRLCATAGASLDRFSIPNRPDSRPMSLLPEKDTLVARTTSADGSLVALIFYGRNYLNRIISPSSSTVRHQYVLTQGEKRLSVSGSAARQAVGNLEKVSAPVGPSDILLTLTAYNPPKTWARTLSLFLPLLMWFSAAAIGWFVVNRLLIRPLVLLRRAVAAYQPGVPLKPLEKVRTPAQEITDLGETFRAISEDVATHEVEMSESLVRQRKLTREVHHRVKNNLQIIASLINLHSRSAVTPDAADAYASIQRRVDALSVVHRNHFAEMEENRGVGIRALVSELAAGLRASGTDGGARLTIQIDSADLHVSQDIAVPVAFLVTELVELAMLCDPAATIRITVHLKDDEPGRAQISVASLALSTTPVLQSRLEGRFDRVLTGLSRQLRAPLRRDEEEGIFCIDIPIMD